MAQQLYRGADAAFPGAPLPQGTQILAAYVGSSGLGRPDTPHIWTAGEWNRYLDADPALRLLPIYVHNFTDQAPEVDAGNAVEAVRALGWAANMPGAQRRMIALDLETMVAFEWAAAVMLAIYDAGFMPVPYGSFRFVVQNPCLLGYWEALLSRTPPAVLAAGQLGVQWAFGGQWDSNVFSQAVWDACGVGRRTG